MPTNPKKRTAIYARVSTQDQNPQMQIRELRSYAKARSFKIVHEFVDRESGIKEDRAELSKLWQAVRARKVDIVLVWKFDRFARSTKQLVEALDEFKHLGVDFISQTEQIDTSSPTGKVLFTMVSAFAEFERELMSERVRAGIARARAQGKPHGRAPFSEDKKKKENKHGNTKKALNGGVDEMMFQRYCNSLRLPVYHHIVKGFLNFC